MSWLAYALIAAVAAAFTAILTKIGVESLPSTLATAIRTVGRDGVRLDARIGSWPAARAGIDIPSLSRIPRALRPRDWHLVACLLSCFATRARRMGGADRQTQSPPAVLLAVVWLREPVSWQVVAGVALMVAGALLTRA